MNYEIVDFKKIKNFTSYNNPLSIHLFGFFLLLVCVHGFYQYVFAQ
jgi:hypothetical protein